MFCAGLLAMVIPCGAESQTPTQELSALEPVRSTDLLSALDAERAMWTVGDEGPVERNLGLFVWPRGGTGWEFHTVHCTPGATTWPKTDDSEAMCRIGDRITVIGSHFGKKTGPLEEKRAFYASFDESTVTALRGQVVIRGMQVRTDGGALWRAANDRLAMVGKHLLPGGQGEYRKLVGPRAAEIGVPSGEAQGYRAINVEGAAVNAAGELVLGLRYPCWEDGMPILLVIPDAAGVIAGRTTPKIAWSACLKLPPGATGPLGFRALSIEGERRWALLGGLDSDPANSVLLSDHPEAAQESSYLVSWTAADEVMGKGPIAGPAMKLGSEAYEGLAIPADGATAVVIVDAKGEASPRKTQFAIGSPASSSP